MHEPTPLLLPSLAPNLKPRAVFQARKSLFFPPSQPASLALQQSLGLNFCPADRDGFNCAPRKQLKHFPSGSCTRKMENRPLMP